MDVYATEEQQIEKIKLWWKEYGNFVLMLIFIAMAGMFSWQMWNKHNVKVNSQASALYNELLKSEAAKDAETSRSIAKKLMSDYAKTPYATFAAFFQAKDFANFDNLPKAETSLNWAIKHAKNKSFRQIAHLRLARVLLAQKEFEKALKSLEKIEDETFLAVISEVRGDVYAAQNEKSKAHQAYTLALQSLPESSPTRVLVEMKRNQVGVSNQSIANRKAVKNI